MHFFTKMTNFEVLNVSATQLQRNCKNYKTIIRWWYLKNVESWYVKNPRKWTHCLYTLMYLCGQIHNWKHGSYQGRKIDSRKSEGSEEKSSPQVKKFLGFANKWTCFVVHTKINETFSRCKVCLQAYIFIDTDNQLHVFRGEWWARKWTLNPRKFANTNSFEMKKKVFGCL